MVKCKCEICGNQFDKPQNEYNRRIRLGVTKFYCSRKCVGFRSENIKMLNESGKLHHFKGGENKIITEYDKKLSGLKEFSRRIRRRKHFSNELNPIDLYKIWERQNGKCAITNVALILPSDSNYKLISNNYKASIDRIDSSKPYNIDNVQFVSITANFLKANMVESDVLDFIRIVKYV